jgi:ClpP class serine protease
MGLNDLWWVFFAFIALQPVIRQKVLEASRLRVLRRIEKARKSRVISLVHRQETMSFLGFPLMRYIDVNDSEDVLRAIELTDPDLPIDLIIHTPGGHALKRHRGKVTVFVPHYAMSGGTLLALAADEIVMSPNAVLGPVDPQLGQHPAVSVLSVLERKEMKEIEDQTLILADIARKALVQVQVLVRDLLQEHMTPEKAESLAVSLSTGTWTHDYAITVEEAKRLGLPVTTEMPHEVYELMRLYPQPTRTRPSVEYVPQPYRRGPGQSPPA